MTTRLEGLFAEARSQRRALLIVYLTAGYPTAAHTPGLLRAVADAGAAIIELGVPFSDPIADGPTIQRASAAALEAGMTFEGALDLAAGFRKTHPATGLVLFGAVNPLAKRGYPASVAAARAAGFDAVLASDVPHEESAPLRTVCREQGLHLIPLVAPTTPSSRVRLITSEASGFVYCISLKGVTGARSDGSAGYGEYLRRLRAETTLPLALGFGISTPAQVRAAVDAGADGVVVGSALIDQIDAAVRAGADPCAAASAFVSKLATELDCASAATTPGGKMPLP